MHLECFTQVIGLGQRRELCLQRCCVQCLVYCILGLGMGQLEVKQGGGGKAHPGPPQADARIGMDAQCLPRIGGNEPGLFSLAHCMSPCRARASEPAKDGGMPALGVKRPASWKICMRASQCPNSGAGRKPRARRA